VLLGALQSGGEKAVALLAKAGPLVGDAIGQAAKRAMKGWFEESATRDTAETTVRGQILAEGGREGLKKARASGEYQRRADALIQQVEDFKRDKLQREGVEIAETLPSGDGGARIARGKEKIAGVLAHGGLIRRQRETAQLPERPPAPTPIPQATDTVRPATEVELEAQRRGVSTDSIFQARIRAKSEKAAREKEAAALKAEIAGTISAQQEEEAAFFGDVTKEQGEADTAAAALTRTRAESKGKLGGRTTVARAEETYNKEQADVKEAEAALHAVKSQGLTNLQSLLQIALQMHGDQVNMASEIKTLKSQIANAREGT
jgi:hypothetical protein